jgi:hypothetical protein
MGTGSADASVSGGTMPYTYSWSNGATTQDISNLGSGIYTLAVTDANNCMTTCDVVIGGLICSISQTACDQNNFGSAQATVTGGTAPYTYLWSTGETTSSISGLIPDRIYGLVVVDAEDCETACEIFIERCNTCDIICSTAFARLDGFEHCFDQFGFSEWGWTNGLLGQGSYAFDLYSEALQCNINNGTLVGEVLVDYTNDEVTVTYNMFGDYVLSLTSLYVGCTDIPTSNGAQTIAPSQYPYIQSLDDATTYTYVIDVSSFPCEGIYVIAHAEVCLPNELICNIVGTNPDCNGNLGIADASVVGGIAPYRFLWSTGETTEDISGLTGGYYTLTVTDENNCAATCDVALTYPTIPSPSIGPFCQNDAPYDLSDVLTNPSLMGSWSGPGVRNNIFYPSAMSTGMHDVYYNDEFSCVSSILSIFVDTICCPLDYAEVNGRKLIGIQSDTVHYETNGILESEQLIEANTIYDSKRQICLQPEFEVTLGTTFIAQIDGCPCRLESGVSVQEYLNDGVNPIDLYDCGVPLDSLYGKAYGGGLLFYLDVNNLYGFDGLIAGHLDLTGSPAWLCEGTDNSDIPNSSGAAPYSGPGSDIGFGLSNTVLGCLNPASAARRCLSFNNGFDDWFLPSYKELEAMYQNLHQQGFGNFDNSINALPYWSSSEFDANSAPILFFNQNTTSLQVKSAGGLVRPARMF